MSWRHQCRRSCTCIRDPTQRTGKRPGKGFIVPPALFAVLAMGRGLLVLPLSEHGMTISSLRSVVRVSLPGFAAAISLGGVDPREIVRRAVATDERNWRVARNNGFLERVDARPLDAQDRGTLKPS